MTFICYIKMTVLCVNLIVYILFIYFFGNLFYSDSEAIRLWYMTYSLYYGWSQVSFTWHWGFQKN